MGLERRARRRYKEIQTRCGKHLRYLNTKCEIEEADFVSFVLENRQVIEFYDKIGLSWSVDRINSRGDYSLGNIQIISRNENSSRVHGDYDWQKTMKRYLSKKIKEYKIFSVDKFTANDIVVVLAQTASYSIQILDEIANSRERQTAKHFVIYSREGFRLNSKLPLNISVIFHNKGMKQYEIRNLDELKSPSQRRAEKQNDKRQTAINSVKRIEMPREVKRAVLEVLTEKWPLL